MVDPEKPKEKPFYKKIQEDEKFQKGFNFFWDQRIEFLSGALMFIGLILSFFFILIGGLLVGLAFGMCFFGDIQNYFLQLRDLYAEHGLFKTLMLIGTALFLLISVPTFLVGAAIGFGVIYLIQKATNSKS